jgi:predicted DNA binding CopG/RHH family protein
MKKGIQYFSEEYLKSCRGMTPGQIIEFLENYRMLLAHSRLGASHEKSLLISLKIKPSLLQAFKAKAASKGTPYQTQIKKLMMKWLSETD